MSNYIQLAKEIYTYCSKHKDEEYCKNSEPWICLGLAALAWERLPTVQLNCDDAAVAVDVRKAVAEYLKEQGLDVELGLRCLEKYAPMIKSYAGLISIFTGVKRECIEKLF